MITEKGTIRVETDVTADMQREFVRKIFICCVIALVVGCVGVVGYLAWDVTSIFVEITEPSIWILFAFAVPFAFGLIFVVAFRKAIKQAQTGRRKREIYEFYSNYLIAEDYLDGEKVATVKFYYNQIVKSKETKNYLFFYVQQSAACPVCKTGLTDGELNALRTLFGLKPQGETAVTLATGTDESAAGVTPAGSLSSDPFAEFGATQNPQEVVKTDKDDEPQATGESDGADDKN